MAENKELADHTLGAMILGLGQWRVMVVIAAFAIFCSLLATGALGVLLDFHGESLARVMLIGAIVPAIVAPLVTHFLIHLLYKLERARADLAHIATMDGLTQVYNRRYFMDRLEIEVARSSRNRQPLSLLMIDADNFKSINDNYGHSTGDRVLAEIARASGDILRGYDVFARYGGEEFTALLPDVAMADACTTAERMRAAVAMLKIETPAGAVIGVTVSVGVSTLIQSDKGEKLLGRADAAMYEAKRGGGNRWVC